MCARALSLKSCFISSIFFILSVCFPFLLILFFLLEFRIGLVLF